MSAVSPDCVIAKSSVPSSIGGLRYRNSLAYSTSTGSRANCSIRYSPTSAACQLVPQPVSTIRRTFSIGNLDSSAHPKVPSSVVGP